MNQTTGIIMLGSIQDLPCIGLALLTLTQVRALHYTVPFIRGYTVCTDRAC